MLPDPFQVSLDSFARPTQAQATATPMDLEVVPATQNPWGVRVYGCMVLLQAAHVWWLIKSNRLVLL